MDGEQRRKKIIEGLSEATKPVSATYFANSFGVSRQVIVQDIALLRATGYDILATARGYLLNKEVATMHKRIILVKHTKSESERELNCIVDNGGRVRDAIVIHPLYGELVGDLMLKTRRDVKEFITRLNELKISPLSELTDGIHMHTIEAASEEELDYIEKELDLLGYLFKQ